jgi:hypothetical protein
MESVVVVALNVAELTAAGAEDVVVVPPEEQAVRPTASAITAAPIRRRLRGSVCLSITTTSPFTRVHGRRNSQANRAELRQERKN